MPKYKSNTEIYLGGGYFLNAGDTVVLTEEQAANIQGLTLCSDELAPVIEKEEVKAVEAVADDKPVEAVEGEAVVEADKPIKKKGKAKVTTDEAAVI